MAASRRTEASAPAKLKLIEVGIPADVLRSIEIYDIPAARRASPALPIDGAIWTTVATQAWRESERALWAKMPKAIQERSLLAVKFCDLVEGGGKNLKRLQARLETSAKPYFRAICFIEDAGDEPAAAAARNKILVAQLEFLAQEFAAERMNKAMAIARRVMTNALGKLGPALESQNSATTQHPVAKISRELFDEDWGAALTRPLAPGGVPKPAILRTQQSSGGAAKATLANARNAISGWPPNSLPNRRPRWVMVCAAAVVAGAAALAVFLAVRGGEDANPVANPPSSASGVAEQDAKAEAEKRRRAEAEAAATIEARKSAEAEAAAGAAIRKKGEEQAAAAEARRKAEAEAAAAEARRKAEAQAAAAEVRRRAEAEAAEVEARRRAEAEAAETEARRRAEVQAVEAEARRRAEAEAEAAEERKHAEAEAAARDAHKKAAAAEAHRKAEAAAAEAKKRKEEAEAVDAERRRRAVAEEAPHRSSGSSPIMHGIGQ